MTNRILFENAFWAVTDDGLESKRVEGWYDERFGRFKGYVIERKKLEECDWIEHMVGKVWITPLAFVEAYYAALRLLSGKEFERNVPALLPDPLAEAFAAEKTCQGPKLITLKEILEGESQDRRPKMLIFVNEQHAVRYQCKALLTAL